VNARNEIVRRVNVTQIGPAMYEASSGELQLDAEFLCRLYGRATAKHKGRR